MPGLKMMPAFEIPEISPLGEFRDTVWENNYRQNAWPEAKRLISACSIFGGIIFLLAGIGDYLALGASSAFAACLAGRLLAALSAAYPIAIAANEDYNPTINTAVLALNLAFGVALCIITLAKTQTMGTLPITAIATVVIFLVVPPIKMMHLIIGALTVGSAFILCFALTNQGATVPNVTILALLMVLVIVLGLVTISRQNALRRRAYFNLSHAEDLGRKYRMVVENADAGILISQDGYIRYANPWLVNRLGYTLEEITSQPFNNFVHPEDRQMVIETHLRRLAEKSVPAKSNFRVVGPKGEITWFEISGALVDWDGQKAALNFLSDASESMQLREQELAQERIDAAIQTAGAACHELNQPLQNILMQAELTMMSLDEEHPLHRRLAKIMTAANEMTAVTQRLNRITSFHTKDYVGGAQILDLERSAAKPSEDEDQ